MLCNVLCNYSDLKSETGIHLSDKFMITFSALITQTKGNSYSS